MIEFASLAYGLLKDIAKFLTLEEEDKVVDLQWLEKSGFGQAARDSGFDIHWVRLNKVESRKLDGYQIMYEVDELARKKRRLVVNNELILMGKPN